MNIIFMRPDGGEGYENVFKKVGDKCAKFLNANFGGVTVVEFPGIQVKNAIPLDEKAEILRARRKKVSALLQAAAGANTIDAVVFACHGWSGGFQTGFDRKSVKELAQLLYTGNPNVIVSLNACSTGMGGIGGDGGFADLLRDNLCKVGATHCRVEGHTTVGHAFCNPYLRRFEGEGSPVGGLGGFYHVEPKSKLFPTFVRLMKTTTLPFAIPFLTNQAIADIVTGQLTPSWLRRP